MNIYLGNLSVEQIERDYGVEFSQEDKNWLKEHRRQAVNSIPLGKDKWHCYDIPRIFAVGSKEFAHELFNRLKNYEFKGQIEIGVDER